MKKILCLLLILAACKKETESLQTIAADEQPDEQNQFFKKKIADQILFAPTSSYPEGVAFDKFNNRFLVSSFAGGTIGAVTTDGTYTPFIQDENVHSTLGLHIDEARKRIAVAITDGLYANVAKVGIYDLQTGNKIRIVDLAALRPGTPHLADDLAIDPQGNVYVTDVKSPVIYKVDVNGNASVFFENNLYAEPPGPKPYYWVGFNGIVYDKNGFLIVGFYAGGKLVKIPIDNPGNFTEVQLDTPMTSPDGLLLSENGKELIVVDNKYLSPAAEIVRYESHDKWITARRVETYATGFTSPTTATSDGKEVYALYSYLFDIFFGTPNAHTQFEIQKLPLDKTNKF